MKRFLSMFKKVWPYVFFAVICLLSVYMTVFMAQNVLDGDTSDYLQRGYVMAYQHRLIPRGYSFTTELRLFDASMIYACFFLFLEDWTLVRVLGTLVLQTLCLLGFFSLAKSLNIKRRLRFLGAGLLLLPVSCTYARYILYHNYYTLYMSEAFFLFSLLLQLKKNSRCPWRWAAYLLLWFVCGLNGVRMMVFLGVPLALALLWLFLLENRSRTNLLPMLKSESAKRIWILAAGFAAFLPGYLINALWLCPKYGVQNFSTLTFEGKISAEWFNTLLNQFASVCGIRKTSAPLLGLRGVSLVCALVIMAVPLFLSLRGFFKDSRLPEIFPVVWILSNCAIICFSGQFSEGYLTPVIAFIIVFLVWQSGRGALPKRMIVAAVILCICFQGAYTARFLLNRGMDETDDWAGLPQNDMTTAEQLQPAADYLMACGDKVALAPYWYATEMSEITNGRVITGSYWQLDTAPGLVYVFFGNWKEPFYAENRPQTMPLVIHQSEEDVLLSLCPEAAPEADFGTWKIYRVETSAIDFSLLDSAAQ